LGGQNGIKKKKKEKIFVAQNKIQNFKGGQNQLLKMERAK